MLTARRSIALLLTILVTLPSGVGGKPPAPAVRRVVVIGIDGLGAEGVRRVNPPNMSRMMSRGAWTLGARAVLPTVSAPNWASMIMGAGPVQHGVTSNEWRADKFEITPICKGSGNIFPTIFGLLREQHPGAIIGIFHDWDGFGHLFERKAIDQIVDAGSPAEAVVEAGKFIAARRPTLTFIHLDDVDHAGHNHGWGSDKYDAAILDADKLIGDIEAQLTRTGLANSTYLLVTADHGGKGDRHGGLSRGEIEIPWIITGPGIRPGEITSPVNTYDTAATIATILGLKPPACWIGRPVKLK